MASFDSFAKHDGPWQLPYDAETGQDKANMGPARDHLKRIVQPVVFDGPDAQGSTEPPNIWGLPPVRAN